MENLADYSQFVLSAYAVAGALLLLLGAVTLIKYSALKAKIKNDK